LSVASANCPAREDVELATRGRGELLSIGARVMNYEIKTVNVEFSRGGRAAPLVAATS
jgi:hypothetical protein